MSILLIIIRVTKAGALMLECVFLTFAFCFNIIAFSTLPLLEPTDAKEFSYRHLCSRLPSFLSVTAAAVAAFGSTLAPFLAAALALSVVFTVAAVFLTLTPFVGATLALSFCATLALSFIAVVAV
jgi:hypothetical protein